jgi:2-keto-4-pentenoate hydratase/2-oxohepta-3-ene-1,7-dioic acid hydratase in catechol pathway
MASKNEVLTLKLAGKRTDADATDRTITYTPTGVLPDGFSRVVLDCRDCTAEMTFSFNEPIATATKPLYLKPGDYFDEYVITNGQVIHYSGAGTFRYQAY